MSCDRIAEALHHLPEKQLTGHNRLEGFETQISRPGTPSISFTRGDLYAAVFAPAFLTANLIEATNGSIHFNECEDAIRDSSANDMEMKMRMAILVRRFSPLIAAVTAQATADPAHQGNAAAAERLLNSNAYDAPREIARQSNSSNYTEGAMTSGIARHSVHSGFNLRVMADGFEATMQHRK
jgi:hypothetical protein